MADTRTRGRPIAEWREVVENVVFDDTASIPPVSDAELVALVHEQRERITHNLHARREARAARKPVDTKENE